MAGIEEHAVSNARVGDLAASLGVTDRHLRRITEAELGVSPVELAQTQQVSCSRSGCSRETSLNLTDIAFAVGFRQRAPLQRAVQIALWLESQELAAHRHGDARPRSASWTSGRRWPGTSLLAYLQARARPGRRVGRTPRIIGAPWRSAMLAAGSPCRCTKAASRSNLEVSPAFAP